MANNRMVLACNVCIPKDEDWKDIMQKGVLHIAKWYPGGDGSYSWFGGRDKEIEDFLIEHAHLELRSESYLEGAGQPNPVRILYESSDLPVLRTN